MSCSIELLYADVDPNEMRFKRAACFDVGVQCGGGGRIVLELKVVDRKEAWQLGSLLGIKADNEKQLFNQTRNAGLCMS